jgi:hypothetical protein
VDVGCLPVPLLKLAWEQRSYRLLGRDGKTDLIREFIDRAADRRHRQPGSVCPPIA